MQVSDAVTTDTCALDNLRRLGHTNTHAIVCMTVRHHNREQSHAHNTGSVPHERDHRNLIAPPPSPANRVLHRPNCLCDWPQPPPVTATTSLRTGTTRVMMLLAHKHGLHRHGGGDINHTVDTLTTDDYNSSTGHHGTQPRRDTYALLCLRGTSANGEHSHGQAKV